MWFCTHPAHVLPQLNLSRCEAFGTPQAVGVMYPSGTLVGHLCFCHPALQRWGPPSGKGHVVLGHF